MKKLFFAALAAAALCSCIKDDLSKCPQGEQEPQVRLSFDAGELNTRAFFDNTSTAEPYEKEITKMDIFVCDANGKGVMHKRFTADEVQSLKGGLYVPTYCEGTVCTFYAVANFYRYVYFSSEEGFLKVTDDNNTPYTPGTFSAASSYSRQGNGFTMTATKKVLIGPNGTITDVSMTLKRTVAKIAIKTKLVDGFAERYHMGKAWIKSVELVGSNKHTPLIGGTGAWIIDEPLKVLQDASQIDGESCNLLYPFENPAKPLGNDMKLVFTIEFDMDGSMDTHDDRILSTCTVPFEGHGGGEIRRNGYYRIQATIKEFDAIEVSQLVAAGDWEPPVTQVIDDLR